jgi:hypothetical protein
MRRIVVLGMMALSGAGILGGADDFAAKIAQAKKELAPSFLTLKGEATVGDFLATAAKQTGNTVEDRRQTKSKQTLNLDFDKVPFWPALDRFCQLAGCAYTAYGDSGGIALIDGTRRSPHVSYHGITRTTLTRVAVMRDLASAVHTCALHLDVAWEPRFQPYYLGVGSVSAMYAAGASGKVQTVKAPARGQMPVAGRAASGEIVVHLPAPERSSPAIDLLEGTFTFLGASKMLTFRFREIKSDAALQQDEVSVRLTKVKEGIERWQIEVQIDNPEGTPVFESFQTWLDNNRILLVKTVAGKTRALTPEPFETVHLETNRKAVVEYAFKAEGKLADWALVYYTPGRIVELTLPYSFKNVPLP